MIRVKEAGMELKISERHLRRLVAQRKNPYYKLNPRVHRFDLNELRDYMRLLAEGDQERRKEADEVR